MTSSMCHAGKKRWVVTSGIDEIRSEVPSNLEDLARKETSELEV